MYTISRVRSVIGYLRHGRRQLELYWSQASGRELMAVRAPTVNRERAQKSLGTGNVNEMKDSTIQSVDNNPLTTGRGNEFGLTVSTLEQ